MPSWRRPRRRLLGWLSNSRKDSGSREANQRNGGRWSGAVFCFRLLVAPIAPERRLNSTFALVGCVFWENGVCWVVFNDVGGFD